MLQTYRTTILTCWWNLQMLKTQLTNWGLVLKFVLLLVLFLYVICFLCLSFITASQGRCLLKKVTNLQNIKTSEMTRDNVLVGIELAKLHVVELNMYVCSYVEVWVIILYKAIDIAHIPYNFLFVATCVNL